MWLRLHALLSLFPFFLFLLFKEKGKKRPKISSEREEKKKPVGRDIEYYIIKERKHLAGKNTKLTGTKKIKIEQVFDYILKWKDFNLFFLVARTISKWIEISLNDDDVAFLLLFNYYTMFGHICEWVRVGNKSSTAGGTQTVDRCVPLCHYCPRRKSAKKREK